MPLPDGDGLDESFKIDFTSPEFITKNINYARNFEEFNIINEECRSRMIHTSCDQTCFYVLCALKAYELIGEIPSIVIYGGGGVMGSCIIDALIECGCKPLLKVFARDSATVQKWLDAGIRSTVTFEENSKMDILVIASNIMNFSQLCRDVGHCLKSTTFVISAVFSLQRKRIFHLFGAPGVVRTFVERKMSKRKKFSSAKLLLYRTKDAMENTFKIVENYMVLLGIEPIVARELLFNIFLGRNNVQHHATHLSRPDSGLKPLSLKSFDLFENENDEETSSATVASPLSCLSSFSPCPSSTDVFTPIKSSLSRQGSGDELASFSPKPPSSPQLPPSSPLLPSIQQSQIRSTPNSRPNTSETGVNMHELCNVIEALESNYGVLFAEELSKHVDEMKLPSIHAVLSSKVLNPMPPKKIPKKNRRISVRESKSIKPRRIYCGYLDEKALLRIFNSDKKTAPDVKTSDYLEYINSLSGDEDDDDDDGLDAALENMSGASDEVVMPVLDKYVVKSNLSRSKSSRGIISRMQSDIFVGKSEGKRFNVPSNIEEVIS
jgi:hypothetical protein